MFDIIAELKSLKLHGMAAAFTDLTAQGTEGIDSSQWLIKHLLEAESTDRAMRSIRYQLIAAKFPIHRNLADFDFSQSKVDRSLIGQLAHLAFTEAAHNVVFIGGTGTGKIIWQRRSLSTASRSMANGCDSSPLLNWSILWNWKRQQASRDDSP